MRQPLKNFAAAAGWLADRPSPAHVRGVVAAARLALLALADETATAGLPPRKVLLAFHDALALSIATVALLPHAKAVPGALPVLRRFQRIFGQLTCGGGGGDGTGGGDLVAELAMAARPFAARPTPQRPRGPAATPRRGRPGVKATRRSTSAL